MDSDDFTARLVAAMTAVEKSLVAGEKNRASFLAAAQRWSVRQAEIDDRLARALRSVLASGIGATS